MSPDGLRRHATVPPLHHRRRVINRQNRGRRESRAASAAVCAGAATGVDDARRRQSQQIESSSRRRPLRVHHTRRRNWSPRPKQVRARPAGQADRIHASTPSPPPATPDAPVHAQPPRPPCDRCGMRRMCGSSMPATGRPPARRSTGCSRRSRRPEMASSGARMAATSSAQIDAGGQRDARRQHLRTHGGTFHAKAASASAWSRNFPAMLSSKTAPACRCSRGKPGAQQLSACGVVARAASRPRAESVAMTPA